MKRGGKQRTTVSVLERVEMYPSSLISCGI